MMNDKIVLVTGASRGIGRAIARAAAGEGATVVINYNHSEAEAKGLAEELRSRGLKAETFRADVSAEAEVQALFKFMRERFGRLDVLVPAGIVGNNLLLMTPPRAGPHHGGELRGSFLCLRAAAKMMMKQSQGASSTWPLSWAGEEQGRPPTRPARPSSLA